MYTGQLLLLKKMMPMSEFEGVKITAVDNFQGIYEYVYSAHVCANMLVPCVLVDFCHLATKKNYKTVGSEWQFIYLTRPLHYDWDAISLIEIIWNSSDYVCIQ